MLVKEQLEFPNNHQKNWSKGNKILALSFKNKSQVLKNNMKLSHSSTANDLYASLEGSEGSCEAVFFEYSFYQT